MANIDIRVLTPLAVTRPTVAAVGSCATLSNPSLRYENRALYNGTTRLFWTSYGWPDTAGAASGVNPLLLTDIMLVREPQ